MYSLKNLNGAYQELGVLNFMKSARQSVAGLSLAVALKMLPMVGLPLTVFNCIANDQIDLTEINNTGKATQTEWLSNNNITVNGGVRWRNAFAAPNTGAASPEFDLPNKNFRHVKDNTVLARVWRLDASGNRMTGEAHQVQIDNTTGRVIDDADNNSPNGTFKINNYPEFTTEGPVDGVQVEFYYYGGTAAGHPWLLSEYSSAIMNPTASVNRNANLSENPLFIIDQASPSATADYYLGFPSNYSLPSEVGIIIGEGSSKREIKVPVSDVFSGGLVSDGNYLSNNAAIVKAKLTDKIKNYLKDKGSVVLSLPNYPRVPLVNTQIDSVVSNAFGAGNTSNINNTTLNQNYGGVDNSSLWTVAVVTDSNGVQYNEYTIANADWNNLATTYGIPVGQLRIMIVRGDAVNDSATVANNLVTGGYSSASPLGTVAAYEALKIDVPVNLTDGSSLSTPVTNPVSGLGAEIGQGSTGSTVIRIHSANATFNAERTANDGSIKIIVLQAGVASPMFVHPINLSISSGQKTQKDHEITEYEAE